MSGIFLLPEDTHYNGWGFDKYKNGRFGVLAVQYDSQVRYVMYMIFRSAIKFVLKLEIICSDSVR